MMNRSQFLKLSSIGAVSLPAIVNDGIPVNDELIKPKKLRQGDTIALSAPAGIVHDAREFTRMRNVLESMGFNVVFGEFVRERYGYFAGTDYQRALDLMRFFTDDTIDAIVTVRGGWGCARILPHLDFKLIRSNPKVFCGFSDVTTLHLAFLKYSRLITYHGPNGTSDWTELTRNNFKQVLMNGKKVVFRSNNRAKTIIPGQSSGRLIGGNLTILTTAIGTDYQPDLTGAILFIEDIAESPYKIDRMLTHLKRANMLDNLSGFIFGRCTNCAEARGANFTINEVIEDHIKPLGIPAITGMDIGHDPDNFTIPVGIKATLDADTGTLSISGTTVS